MVKGAFYAFPAFLLGYCFSNLLSGFQLGIEMTSNVVPDDSPIPVSHGTKRLQECSKTPAEPISIAYGKYCNSTILGQRQRWNIRHKKILSYAVFLPAGKGELPKWIEYGIEIQAETAKLYYPGWTIRLHASGLPTEMIDDLLQRHDNIEIVRCTPMSSNARMMLHRLLAYDDPTVMMTLVRDVDSRFSLRELMAVNEWLGQAPSEYTFHVMRDHSNHLWPVMGGTLGMTRGMLNNSSTTTTTMLSLVDQALEEHPGKIEGFAGEDQAFLSLYVWPLVKNMALAHDMRSLEKCKELGSKACRDFPLGPRKQQGEPYFVGAQFKSKAAGLSPNLCFD